MRRALRKRRVFDFVPSYLKSTLPVTIWDFIVFGLGCLRWRSRAMMPVPVGCHGTTMNVATFPEITYRERGRASEEEEEEEEEREPILEKVDWPS